MSRAKRFASALGSGYLALAANVVYTVLSVPLALHYLKREEFGLWALVGQITGYFALLDFGVGQSVSRILIDYKDDVNGGEYGATLKTASIVFIFQAAGIFLVGAFGSHLFARVLHIPQQLRSGFQMLMFLQCSVAALNFAMTPFWLPLWSHQRSDIVNFAAVGIFVSSGLALWIGFEAGLRYYSLVLSNFVGVIMYIGATGFATLKLGFFPSYESWGKITRAKFREIFGFSRDLFLLQVATQFISASQIVLVSRLIGLDAAAVWSVCTKFFTLAQLIVFKIYDFSAPGFSEMFVRGEIPRFRERLGTIVSITAVGAGLFAVLGAFGNRTLVMLWTGGKVTWNELVDVCAACYLFLTCITRCYTGVTGMVKRIGYFKYVSLLEGVLVVLGSVWLAPTLHFVGVFLSGILANLFCSGLYGVNLVANRFETTVPAVTIGWFGPSLRFVAVFSCLTGLIFWIGNQFHGVVPFILSAVFSGGAGLMLAFLVGLRKETRMELLSLARQLEHTMGFATSRGDSEPDASRPAFVAAAGAVSIDPSKDPAPEKQTLN
jgi:O-antigen/teichoic acid export membrane protein